MEKSQFASGVCGVGPAESTGKPRSRYCPGGSLPLSSLGFRRLRNPREKNPSLIFSPPALLFSELIHLCAICAFFAPACPGPLLERLVGEKMLSIPVREPSRRLATVPK